MSSKESYPGLRPIEGNGADLRECLDDGESRTCERFLARMKTAGYKRSVEIYERGPNRIRTARTRILRLGYQYDGPGDKLWSMRAYPIGIDGEQPTEQATARVWSNLFLCEDGKLRVLEVKRKHDKLTWIAPEVKFVRPGDSFRIGQWETGSPEHSYTSNYDRYGIIVSTGSERREKVVSEFTEMKIEDVLKGITDGKAEYLEHPEAYNIDGFVSLE